MEELISIVMATYNGEKYLRTQIDSVLQQSYRCMELIIIDDASTDLSHEVALEFAAKDRRVKALRNLRRLGITANFLKGISASQGSFICYCDQDDLWHEHKVEILAELLRQHSRNMLVYSDAEVCDVNLKVISQSFWKASGIRPRRGFLGEKMILRNLVPGCTMMFRRKVANHLAKVSADSPFLHDHLAFLVGACLGRIVYTKKKLVKYRQHRENNIGVFFRSRFDKAEYTNGLSQKIAWIENNLSDLNIHLNNIRHFCDSLARGSLADRLPLMNYYLFLREDRPAAQLLGCFQCLFPSVYDRLRQK